MAQYKERIIELENELIHAKKTKSQLQVEIKTKDQDLNQLVRKNIDLMTKLDSS